MTGLAVAAGDARLRTFAAQRAGDFRTAVGEYLVRPERGVAGADEFGGADCIEADPPPVVQLALRGPGR